MYGRQYKMSNVVELDVREQLRNKEEPFPIIMGAVSKLGSDDTFILHTTFNPVPLLNVMKGKGFDNKVEELEPEHFVITFTPKK
jgi:hypothetical protein